MAEEEEKLLLKKKIENLEKTTAKDEKEIKKLENFIIELKQQEEENLKKLDKNLNIITKECLEKIEER